MECCHAKRVWDDAHEGPASRGCGIVVHRACKFILQIIQPGISRLVCVWGGAAVIMITKSQGGQVTHVLLTLRGASFDHHENHLRPQYNLSVFCRQQATCQTVTLSVYTADSNGTSHAY